MAVPLLVYFVIEEAVFAVWQILFGQVKAGQVLPLTAFSWGLALIPLGRKYWMSERDGRRERRMTPTLAVCFGAAGIGGCLFFNGLLRLLPLPGEGYRQVSQVLYGPGLLVQLISMGVVIPMGEELVFRGLAYGSIRREIPGLAAVLLSAAYFGVYHGNLRQGLYAGFLGIFLAGCYEWGGLWGCFLFHGAANMTAVILQGIGGLPTFR